MKEESELDLEPTVTQEDIDQCLEKAEAIKKKIASDNKEDDEYLIYKEEIEEESLTFKKITS